MYGFLAEKLDTIPSSIAERYFERLQPRYTIPGRSFVKDDWEEGQNTFDEVVTLLDTDFDSAAQAVYECVPDKKRSLDTALGAIAVLVHCYQDQLGKLDIPHALKRSRPVVLRAFRENHGTGCILAWLWTLATFAKEKKLDLEQEDVVPVIQSLMPVAAMSPDPAIRFITFRLLDTLLSLTNDLVHLSILKDFMSPECPFPQMRVAAVGLLKDSVLAALRQKAASPFNTPVLMQTLGPTLLRPQPSDLFNENLPLSDFVDSYEPARLVECMSFLYALLSIDKENRTAVRDAMPEFQAKLLKPIRERLKEWEPEMERDDEVSMALSGLIMSVERFDSILT